MPKSHVHAQALQTPRRHPRPLARWLALAVLAVAPLAAPAADMVTDALQQAYAPYRTALFKTNGKSQDEARAALDAARTALAHVRARFGAQPPAPYDRDARFATTLDQVAEVYTKATAEVARNDLAAAHETLEAARDLLAALRLRNGVVVFSDAMNEYHEVMEQVLIEGPKWLANGAGRFRLTTTAGALDYLAERLKHQAPPDLAAQPDFQTALTSVRQSVQALLAALAQGDEAAIRAAIGQLKGPYSRMFQRFG